LNLKEFERRKRYTNSLYWFTLKPRATSSPQNPLGNPLSNQLQITHKHHQRSDIDPFKKHTSFGSAHPHECWSWQPQEHTTLLGFTTPECTKYSEWSTLVTESTEINTYVILFHSLLRKPKLKGENSNLESNLRKTQICFSLSLFVIKH